MKTLSEHDFLEWATQHELKLDERYPHSAVLVFPDPELDRFWVVPPEPEWRPFFISSMLELCGNWQSCYVWRHLGNWPRTADPSRVNDVVELQILKGLEIPLGTGDVLEIPRQDAGQLIALMFTTTIFGRSVGEDFYVVPEIGRHVLKVSHHNVIECRFRHSEDLDYFVAEMEKRGFPLPDELPDETFKTPPWMTPR